MLVLSQAEVTSVLDMGALIDTVEAAMVEVSAGRVSMPPRVGAIVAEVSGMLAAMPAYLRASSALTTKLVSVFPENRDRPTHQAVICCFDATTGTPIALMDATHITALRTAAGSAVATRRLMRRGATVVAIIGTGVQARAHVEALRAIGLDQFVVAGREPTRVAALAEELSLESVAVEDGVRRADVVCLTTHAAVPVIEREWIRPGTHVNSVGYNSAGTGEVDVDTVRDAYVVVESRDAALAPPPAGAVELLRAREQGALAEPVAEIGEIVSGVRPGRTDDKQLTLYKSVGVAAQDAAAAALVLAAARARGIGTELAL